MRTSISCRVISPLSLKVIRPLASAPIAASITPICGTFNNATWPRNLSSKSDAQLSSLPPVSSGLYPSVSALCHVGTAETYRDGPSTKSPDSLIQSFRKGASPSPGFESGVKRPVLLKSEIESHSLTRFVSVGCQTLAGINTSKSL